ncbi:MAG: hypothetical protein ABIH42_05560 [Planctomycetota bacterium]
MAQKFTCYKVNVKNITDNLKSKYNIVFAPKILFFTTKGNQVWQLTNVKAKIETIVKKMEDILSNKLF